MSQILIIEDETIIRAALSRLLKRRGHSISEAESVEAAESAYNLRDFDLIIADMRLPGVAGTEVIDRAEGVPVLIMTSYASVRSAVDSMKKGAVDYIAKPFDHDELLIVVNRTLKQNQLERQKQALKSDVEKAYPVAGMVGDHDVMQEIFRRIGKVAPTDTTVLILGESGTGKELAARAVHEQSNRCDAPFITVNCAAIPENLIESELFGHERGAFTGASNSRNGLVESAAAGTLFLDEIGELPMTAQSRLLRVLQDGEIRRVGSEISRRVDVRIIAATNRDLKQSVQDGQFRSDLYFRLRVMELNLPPLRERGSDKSKLAEFMLRKACAQINKPHLKFSADTLRAIMDYHWPGNVRELKNAIERAVILCDSDAITPGLLAIDYPAESKPAASPTEDHDLSLEEYFREFVRQHQGQMTETELARKLGISRKALWERRQRFDIPRPRKNDD